jgi:hypothetical protein
MPIVRGLLDRVILVCAAVAGGLIPGFIAQYRQRLGGHLDQARLDLAPWQKLADQFYQGDVEKLIQYHLSSTDATFHAEGAIIRSLVTTVQQLQTAVDAMHGSLASQALYLTGHADAALAHATFADWVPAFALSGEGLVFAGVFAVIVWLSFLALWWLIARSGRALRRPRPPHHPRRRIEPTL